MLIDRATVVIWVQGKELVMTHPLHCVALKTTNACNSHSGPSTRIRDKQLLCANAETVLAMSPVAGVY